MLSNTINTAVIILGRVDSTYLSTEKITCTHCQTYVLHENINLCAGVGVDSNTCKSLLEKFESAIPVYSSIEKMLIKYKSDIISLCVSPKILSSLKIL